MFDEMFLLSFVSAVIAAAVFFAVDLSGRAWDMGGDT
jgi:hypothetical protein